MSDLWLPVAGARLSHLVPEAALGECLFPLGRKMGAGKTGKSRKGLWAQGERGWVWALGYWVPTLTFMSGEPRPGHFPPGPQFPHL